MKTEHLAIGAAVVVAGVVLYMRQTGALGTSDNAAGLDDAGAPIGALSMRRPPQLAVAGARPGGAPISYNPNVAGPIVAPRGVVQIPSFTAPQSSQLSSSTAAPTSTNVAAPIATGSFGYQPLPRATADPAQSSVFNYTDPAVLVVAPAPISQPVVVMDAPAAAPDPVPVDSASPADSRFV